MFEIDTELNGSSQFAPPNFSINDSLRWMYPTLYLLLNLRPKPERHDAGPNYQENQKPSYDARK